MAIDALKQIDHPGPTLVEVAPPEPKSFAEAASLQVAVRKELASILASASFCTSRKSCEFLKYIVQVALDGRIDSLKERSIGLDLLGRDISYEPSSDATVRVRANEVRKRLKSFYSSQSVIRECRIELFPGSYIPKFVREPNPPHAIDIDVALLRPPIDPRLESLAEEQFEIPRLNLLNITRPAFIALFVCALFLRQQLQSGDPYHQFWDARLQGKSVMIIADEQPSLNIPGSGNIAQAMLPMVWLAGRYDLKPIVIPGEVKSDEKQAGLGGGAMIIHSTLATPTELANDPRLRYFVSGPSDSLRLVERFASHRETSDAGHAAVLTVFPERPAELWIAGTDEKSINSLAEVITGKTSFPTQLNLNNQAGKVMQLLWRAGSTTGPEIYTHQP